MKMTRAIDLYFVDMRQAGRINSDRTEVSYRAALRAHAEDVKNRDPSKTGRTDVKRTLARWGHPNTRSAKRATLVSFYDWAMEEGLRKDNPARQVRRPKRRPEDTYRLTESEVRRMLLTTETRRERWAIYLGLCAGLRNAELRGLQGRHFSRPGWVWVSAEIAKGGRERWIPVVDDLQPIIDEITTTIEPGEYVLCTRQVMDPPTNTIWREDRQRPASGRAVWELVGRVGRNAGIAHSIHPHVLRHAFADHIARHAGIRNAQALLGHQGVSTTETYLGAPTLDQLQAAVAGVTFNLEQEA